jgi:pimeloyl-ACP methyl ester carboxylesterase
MPLIPGMHDKTVDLEDHHIGFSEGQENGPALVLIHGLSGRRDSFLPVIPALLDKFHLFAMDQRGHGLSGITPGHYAIQDYSSDLIGVLRTLFTEPVFVWAQSLGAAVTIEAAVEAPELFRAVVLEDPPLGRSKSRSSLVSIFPVWHELASSSLSVDEIEQRLAGLNMQGTGAAARYKAETLHQLDPDVLQFAIEDRIFPGYDNAATLQRVAPPALLMQADPDFGGIISDEAIAAMQPLPANIRHRKFGGSGHKIHGDQPEKVLEAVLAFLGKN